MVLSDVLLPPWDWPPSSFGAVVVLYLIRPDPQALTLPTFQFLVAGDAAVSDAVLERISRSLLLPLQVLVVLVLAVGLATPTSPSPSGRRSGDGHRRRHERVNADRR